MMKMHSNDSGYNSMTSTDRLSQFSPRLGSQEYGSERSQIGTPSSKTSGELTRPEGSIPAYFTRDGRHRIQLSITDTIAQKLKDRATTDYVDLHQFGIEQDVSFQSLEQLIHTYARGDFPRVIIDVDEKSYLCSDAFADEVKMTIRQAAAEAGSGVTDLTAAFPHHIPPQIIIALATEATEDLIGEIHLAGDHVVWTHSCSTCSSKRQVNTERDQEIDEIVRRLTNEGFCILREPMDKGTGPAEDDGLEQDATSAFLRANPHDAPPKVVYTIPYHAVADTPYSKVKVLVKPRILHEELESMKRAAVHRAELLWQDDASPDAPYEIVRQLEPGDFHAPHNDDLSQILIRSNYIEDVESVVQSRMAQLERHRFDEFTNLIETQLWCPLHLYAAGILSVDDQILKGDLEDSALRQFCRDNIPSTVKTVRERRVLHDEQQESAIARLELASQNVRSFAELQVAVAEAGRDLRIDSPHQDLVLQVKHRTLEKIVVDMMRMDRALDILQNLLWVLLATSGPGLFVSSVKYNRKLIYQYDLVGGDPEVAGLLSLYWEKVREGTATPEDIRQMRVLAEGAVEVWRQENS